jgi:hypothetical protein
MENLQNNTPKKDDQISLFSEDEFKLWNKEWQGMPEFVQEEIRPHKEITLRFESQEDVDEFAKLVKQTITLETKYLWFPEITIERYMDKRWIDKEKNDI